MAVDLVQQLTRTQPQQLRLRRVQSESAHTQPCVDVRDTFSELADCQRNIFDGPGSRRRTCVDVSRGARRFAPTRRCRAHTAVG